MCELTQYARNEPKAHFVEVSKFSFKLRLSHTHSGSTTHTHVNLVGRQEMTVIAIAFACTHTHSLTHMKKEFRSVRFYTTITSDE